MLEVLQKAITSYKIAHVHIFVVAFLGTQQI